MNNISINNQINMIMLFLSFFSRPSMTNMFSLIGSFKSLFLLIDKGRKNMIIAKLFFYSKIKLYNQAFSK